MKLKSTTAKILLQWGHGGDAVDGLEVNERSRFVPELQWGHGGDAVDGLFELGNTQLLLGRFNGATAGMPWMGPS